MAIVVSMVSRSNGQRRVLSGSLDVCRQYSTRAKPCALYEKESDYNEDRRDDDNRGMCRPNEECLPPNDRAKHGYCQCKLGFVRLLDTGKCVADGQNPSSTEGNTTSSDLEFELHAGDDRTLTLPTNQIDLSGRLVFKTNKSEVNVSTINSRRWTLSWALKSSSNGGKADLSHEVDSSSRTTVKQLSEGTYEFEFQLKDNEGTKLASDVVKVEVIAGERRSVADEGEASNLFF
jgi:hypothetical protein